MPNDSTTSTLPFSVSDTDPAAAQKALEDLRAGVPASMRITGRSGRPVHTYPVPENYWDEVGIRSISLVELTADEEMLVMSRMKKTDLGAATKAQYDLAKTSLVAVDGRAVTNVDESLEVAWANLRPKARQLVLRAYQDLHNVPRELESGFLKGRTTSA